MRNVLAALLFATACGSAYADQVSGPAQPGPQIAIDVAPAKIRAPYDVQIIREDGETLPTYATRDRFYVEGIAGQRYSIKISNPTAHRVEAVVSVDGLDAVDGENGDLHKRGYIVPPWGETRIEGFRTSLANVATFRFSSVDGSYAGQKGKARNVGVIAVALFEEVHAPEQEIVNPQPYTYTDDLDEESSSWAPTHSAQDARRDSRPTKKHVAQADKDYGGVHAKRAAPPPADYAPSTPTATGTSSGGGRVAAAPPASKAAPRYEEHFDSDDDGVGYDPPSEAQRTNRPGLGTEFGEARYSAASYTQFVRSTTRPIAIAELRYNDAAGLMALGIPVQPMPDENEVMTRETADPFPGDHFARPVR
ncbi:MAG TPA: hypothetical protein VFQ65_24350 [Kofleriaceae bacterium]|nr:hypothetical protein [Kofleriaceae bacterium]